jgi:hypothetical protein
MPKHKSLDDDPSFIDLRERITRLEADMMWTKEAIKRIDNRTWYVLASVVVFGVISIVLALM